MDKVFMMGNCKQSCGWCPTLLLCEGTNQLLTCPRPEQGLRIVSAMWGRQNTATCPHTNVNDTSCSHNDVIYSIRRTCEGRNYCHISAGGTFTPDPCPGTYKYLELEYYCQECDNFYPSDTECTKLKMDECEGEHEDLKDCDAWAMRGECDRNPKWMFDNCPMSCRICSEADDYTFPVNPRPTKSVDICEGKDEIIKCETMDKSLEIVSAFYGRHDNETCPHETARYFNESMACNTDDALERLKRVCDGRQFCHLSAYNQWGDDPCPDIYKYLNVEYRCKDCANAPEMAEDTDQCLDWAEEGQCEADPGFMENYCYKDCYNCSYSECLNPYGDNIMCDYWGIRGECETNADWMDVQCPMTCGVCPGPDYQEPPPPGNIRECENKAEDEECREWFRRGECEKNPSWMYTNCYKACARCDCENEHTNATECRVWETWGECSGDNKKWMWDNCVRSCSLCEGIPVTHKAWMEFSIGETPVGRATFGVFGDTSPITAKNFLHLVNGTYGFGYTGSTIHRVEKGFVLQGGDFQERNEFGGKSIYGGRFDDENFIVHHYGKGFVNMANAGANDNENQFAILTMEADWLDGKHVVFSKIIDGYDVIEEIENTPVTGSSPQETVTITGGGYEPVTERTEVQKKDVIGTGPTCFDSWNNSTECETWAVAGDCYEGQFQNWMWGNCFKGCSRCDEIFTAPDWGDLSTIATAVTTPAPARACQNAHVRDDICEGWASRGECEENTEWMGDNCYKACERLHRCETDEPVTTTVCEGDKLRIHCRGDKRLNITSAFWGRSEEVTCPHDTTATNTTTCSDPAIMDLLMDNCNEMVNCEGPATVGSLGDPCPGFYKYITITYQCVDRERSNNGQGQS